MSSSSNFSDILVKCWRIYQKDPSSEKGRNSYNSGLKISRKIAEEITSLKVATQDDCLLTTNMAWFSPINKKYSGKFGTNIGIFVDANLSPEKVKSGKCGAGSEYAVIELGDALAKLGYNVYIFTHIDVDKEWKSCLTGQNPQYIPIHKDMGRDYIGPTVAGFVNCFSDLLLREPGDYVLDHLIVWRTYSLENVNFNNYAPKVHFWSHDFSENIFDFSVNTIYVLSEYHKQKMTEYHGYDYEYVIGCNGTGVDLTEPIRRRDRKRVCYSSNYSRGLFNLLCFWPEIRKAIPDAELHIFYGRETWGCLNDQQLKMVTDKIESLSNQGVVERCKNGMLPHSELLEEFKECSILCYPYDGESETFSIICAASGQCGVIPCVKKRHGLVETCSSQEPELLGNSELRDHLISLLSLSEDELYPLRVKARKSTTKYTWENAAKTWASVLN